MKIKDELKFKEYIRYEELRVDSDLKQEEIAKILNVKTNTYTKWELCINDMPLEKSNQLANYYNVSLDYLLGLTNNMIKSKPKNIKWNLLSIRLKELRKKNHLTQVELCEKLGFARSTYLNYEYGINIPTTIKLLIIAFYFQVSIDYLVGRTDNLRIK